MKKIIQVLLISLVSFVIPHVSLGQVMSIQKTFTGTVTKLYDNQITFKTTNAAFYVAETSQATLVRKFGQPMQMNEMLVGDKVEIKGGLWKDNSINATYVRNMSLYSHTQTVVGKVVTVDAYNNSFVMESKTNGQQTIQTANYTIFRKNGNNSSLSALEPNMSVSVHGTFERSKAIISALSVLATVRMVNITVTGSLAIKNTTGLTIAGDNNVLYGVDCSKCKFLNKKGKVTDISHYNLGDTIKITGKHMPGSNQIIAITVKDISGE